MAITLSLTRRQIRLIYFILFFSDTEEDIDVFHHQDETKLFP